MNVLCNNKFDSSEYYHEIMNTWNPNDLYFWRSTPQNKVFSNQNKGHLGSRYAYMHELISRDFFERPNNSSTFLFCFVIVTTTELLGIL